MKLSVCIICKNEKDKIERCLESVKWADEIIVLDSGSTDETRAIANKYTDKVFVRDDWQGFGEQRRRAEALATNDWIFAIDCDEVVSERLKEEIITTLAKCNERNILKLNRLTYFCGQFIRHSGWYPDRIARIYNKKITGYNQNLVHESVVMLDCKPIELKENILHFQHEDIFGYMNKRNHYAHIGAEQMVNKGKKPSLLKASSSAFFSFIRHYFLRRGFLDGKAGFVIAVIQSQYSFNKYLFAYYK
ncbi:(heptosyl)LPS beta-1,4-glucosyltransferase [Pseudoalteromonas sp. DSM 26666]|uniref:glycosyltransferase family 2 protein n=1 Tax=Pseudoalteromonas sp. DSM 26666 TaxID=1761892 RepID=UPI0008E42107|nr:glycosyltransferase family 2 protein [Pseudoalteromonas sp. DSM 26666]SFT38853.1 (heptosyl)LPS beta-1,4-glucosyltransferase [Pseudoalteromonas sp. DSM 26666]